VKQQPGKNQEKEKEQKIKKKKKKKKTFSKSFFFSLRVASLMLVPLCIDTFAR
jgi:hypothetical protein